MTAYPLYGIHGDNTLTYNGWLVLTRGIGADPNDHGGENFTHYPHRKIVRLNHGYHPHGTIPTPDKYADFAQRCANYVRASEGCHIWIIGNEPNLSVERPEGRPIAAEEYAECYRLCRDAIRALEYHSGDQVLVAAIGPWNVETGDWWLSYFQGVQLALETGKCDGFAIHTYWREQTPESVSSTDRMDPPYEFCFYGFLHYMNWMGAILPKFQGLPVYLTEMCTAGEPWEDVDTGCVQAAYAEIDGWNRLYPERPISCAALYRWEYDQWAIDDKPQVHQDFYAAVAHGYTVPANGDPDPPEDDMLLNPSFEDDWYPQTPDGILVLPEHWTAEYKEGDHPYKRPEIKPNQEFTTDGRFSIRAFPPAHARGFYGIWQEVVVEPGQWYKFSADVRVESNPPGKLCAMVGIQPWGGSIFHRQMIWGEEIVNSHDWTRVEVYAQAFGSKIRVAMGADNEFATTNNTTWWDKARLEEWECDGDGTPDPPDPEPGECKFNLTEVRRVVREELDKTVWASGAP